MSMDHGGSRRSEAREASSRPTAGAARKNTTRLLVLLGVAAAALLPISVSAQAQSGGGASLKQAVTEEMGVESNTSARSFASVKDQGRAQVNVRRTDAKEGWAFGTAVIKAPKKRGHYPKGWLFVAEKAGGGWDVALEGTPEFSRSAADAPEKVVSSGEKRMFASGGGGGSRTLSAARKPVNTQLRLPWRKGGLWKFTGGPHGWNTGYDRPYAALDFAGTTPQDQRVTSAAGGSVYNMCGSGRGWIRVYHPNGFSTDYYHLIRNIKPRAGKVIGRGVYLGLTGEDVSCGGASFGRHVHFALLRGNQHVPVSNKIIGGWKFVQGSAYRGYAQRGKTKRAPGSLIRNFGP